MTHIKGKVVAEKDGLRLVAYPGDNMVMLAMSLDETAIDNGTHNLAGFAIWRTPEGKSEQPLLNRLSFDTPVTSRTRPQERRWHTTDTAPIQKFRWVDVLSDGFDAPISYRVTAKYFTGNDKTLRDGPSVNLTVQPPDLAHADFHVAFTRGYASSQAYADKFHNADIRPKGKKTADFDTKPFHKQYLWLGADARKLLFTFLDECLKDKKSRVDVLAYDLDEPDIIKALCTLGSQKRLRAILDNASLHTKDGAVEKKAASLIRKAAAGVASVKQGHFSRFQHNKVFIKRDAKGRAQKVLFGSMNFSLRGLYVQANNIMLVEDATTAGYFAEAFDNAFANKVHKAAFTKDRISWSYKPISDVTTHELPASEVAFSPHSDWKISLGPVAEAIHQAQSSVLFAVMEPKGSGPVLESLQEIAARPIIFSYGTVETNSGLAMQSGDGSMGEVTSYAYLKSKVPAPFVQEWSGGRGMHIHHKFIVIDFNTDHPVVATGSSNLSAGGEESNGDNLILIRDPVIASMYAIEAVRLFDHYSFRKHMQKAGDNTPFTLWYPSKAGYPSPWWRSYYDKTHIKFRDRCLFADLELPPDLATVKQVDWTNLTPTSAKKRKKSTKKSASSSKPKKKTSRRRR